MTEDLLLGDRFRLETSEAEADLPQRELLLTEVASLGEAEEQLLLLSLEFLFLDELPFLVGDEVLQIRIVDYIINIFQSLFVDVDGD